MGSYKSQAKAEQVARTVPKWREISCTSVEARSVVVTDSWLAGRPHR